MTGKEERLMDRIATGQRSLVREPVAVATGLLWTDARDAALDRGGYLATITSENENNFVFSLISDADLYWKEFIRRQLGPWHGGIEVNGQWQWVTGESWSYANWAPGEPNNQPGEDYLQYWTYPAPPKNTWNDAANVTSPYQIVAYVIEYPANPNPVPEPAAIAVWSVLGLVGFSVVRGRRRRAS